MSMSRAMPLLLLGACWSPLSPAQSCPATSEPFASAPAAVAAAPVTAAPTSQPAPPVATAPADDSAQPAAGTSQPAQAVDAKAQALLEQLEASGRRYKSLRSDVAYHVLMKQLGDTELRKGYVAYLHPQGDQPGMFRVHFDTLKLGDGLDCKEVVDYAFDGHYFVMAKHRIKEMTFVQVTAEGQKAQPMKLGEGPFPLPFGQEVTEVLRRFQAYTDGATQQGPPGTGYLRLTPRPESAEESSFVQLEMWVDPQTHLPARIISEDPSRNVTTVDFINLQTDPELPDDAFRLKRGQFGWGWQYHTRRLEEMDGLEP